MPAKSYARCGRLLHREVEIRLTFVPCMFSLSHAYRGDLLRFSIAYALMRAREVVRGLRQGLTEQERYEVADAAARYIEAHGDPWRLSEPLPDVTGQGFSTPDMTPEREQ